MALKILANENVPLDAVELLRQLGHDVVWIRTANPGITDPVVLSIANAQGRLLITFDTDYGELVYRYKHVSVAGIVIFRIAQDSSAAMAIKMASVLESRSDWTLNFSTVDDRNIRMRPLQS